MQPDSFVLSWAIHKQAQIQATLQLESLSHDQILSLEIATYEMNQAIDTLLAKMVALQQRQMLKN